MIKAVYPGTFDPLTRGHEDLVRHGEALFQREERALCLAVGDR